MTKKDTEEENEINPEREYVPPGEEYAAISDILPARDVEMPEQGEKPKTLTESMDEATDLTDLQYAMSKLMPRPVGLDDLMVGRVAPEAFLSLMNMLVSNEIMTADPSKPVNTTEAIVRSYVRGTIGLDGEGRIDVAKLVGAAKEARKPEENLLRGL